ncbi:hypothetical protein ONA24_00340 [Mycoplasmopsis cynos]|uniref:hypothetical protein n=1 Tax=Mycoplasmopsis cynos TaxID=171284 RepID=UPI0024CDB4CD|nr:hypothetical protein [Mycoplasmopsis cynos]WAM09808.1 hypothetical protein ONA24_00340 [Mycoplasmopsis cynos]
MLTLLFDNNDNSSISLSLIYFKADVFFDSKNNSSKGSFWGKTANILEISWSELFLPTFLIL